MLLKHLVEPQPRILGEHSFVRGPLVQEEYGRVKIAGEHVYTTSRSQLVQHVVVNLFTLIMCYRMSCLQLEKSLSLLPESHTHCSGVFACVSTEL